MTFVSQPLQAGVLADTLTYGDWTPARHDYKEIAFGRPRYNFLSHFSFSTNLFDWALVIPNVGVEVDLGNPDRMATSSLYFQFKGSPSSQDYLAKGLYDDYSYKFWNAHAEWRMHFTFHRHPSNYKSRFYAGVYGEYVDYTLHTPLDIRDRKALKDGWGAIGGLSFGYAFPGFSYGNRHFFEFEMGGNVGAIYAKYDAYTSRTPASRSFVLPMLTEIRFALVYRNYSIARKYWQPNLDRYRRIKAEDEHAQHEVEDFLDQLERDPVVIYVNPATDADSTFSQSQTVSFAQVRKAFLARTHSSAIRSEYFTQVDNTPFPIDRPSENSFVGYTLPIRAHDFDSEGSESHFIFPFRVRFEGFDDASSRQLGFNSTMRRYYYDHGKHLPSLTMEPKNRDEFMHSATLDEVIGLFNSHLPADFRLTRDLVQGIYYRTDGEFQPIEENQMDMRGTYALSLRFHQQVTEDYDTLATRFVLEPYIDNSVQGRYNSFISEGSTPQFFINRPWRNGRESVVTKADVLETISSEGYYGFTDDNIIIADTLGYGRTVGKALFGNALPELSFVVTVQDNESLRNGNVIHQLLQKAMEPKHNTWNKAAHKDNLTYGPGVWAHYDADGNPVPDRLEDVIAGVTQCLNRVNRSHEAFRIEDFMIEDYFYTGIHHLPYGKPSQRWTVLRFAYRYTTEEGRVRIAHAQVAYRLRLPK